mmetsp:Transcript_23877/g.77642  ORF Transcript_23877/g.77642 Transcript_23877/m.77642 type:complete len:583 (+) Transcript_23877:42-1790(+)
MATSAKADAAKAAAAGTREAVNDAQFKGNEALKKKAEGLATKEIDALFSQQEALQEEARTCFDKYDADGSRTIDADELHKVLEDMQFFEGLEADEALSLTKQTLAEVDENGDNQLSFDEFVVCYNKLVTKQEEFAAAAAKYKVPPIFGADLSPEETERVKAMPGMLERSVFGPRKKEAASKDFFDTVGIRDKAFKLDWGRIDKKSTFVNWKCRVGLAEVDKKSGKVKATKDLKFFKTMLRQYYDLLCNAFTYYCCRSLGGAHHAIDYDEFYEFAKACGFRHHEGAGQKFGQMDLKALFNELNQEDEATAKKKKVENELNDDDAFMRFEFLELVMRMALAFPQNPDNKIAFQGFLMFAKNNIERECKAAALDRNVFRKDRLYTPEVTGLFGYYQKELACIYSLIVGTDFKDATIEEWVWFLKRIDVFDEHVTEGECVLIFTLSQMLVADELKNRDQYCSMSFTEFCEGLGRLADAKDLPTAEDLQQHGLASTLVAVETMEAAEKANPKKKPPRLIPRRPSSEFWTVPVHERPLQARLKCLLDYIFGMFSPACGSILLGTYDRGVLLDSLAEECKSLHGKVLWS